MENKRVIVLDIGNLQFRAMFNYLSLYKKNIDEIIQKERLSIYHAKKELDIKMKNREIFLGQPNYTFCNMIGGYYNKLEVTLEDLIVGAQDYGSWRKEISKEYKQQRKTYLINAIMKSLYLTESEAEQWKQNQYDIFNDLYQKLSISLPLNFIKIFKAEADDIASVCCRYYVNKEMIILITTDKDWEMLLSFPNVKIFSPISKKFKKVPNPTKVLLDKIQGDISDNLLTKPSSEAEFIKRKLIVDLINPLPEFIENPIKEELSKIMPKNIYLHKIPFQSIREKFKRIYNLNE
jgi:hypothetical protein